MEVTSDPGAVLRAMRPRGSRASWRGPLADDLTRGEALRFGALLHDAGKPATRAVTDEGRVLFWGHDGVGADIARSFGRRMHASAALGDFLAALAQHHLRLGFLVHEQPLSRRHVYRYLRACEPVEVEVTVLSVADRLATLGPRTREEAVGSHVDARERDRPRGARPGAPATGPRAPVRGDDLIAELGIEPGPEVGPSAGAGRRGGVRRRGHARASEALALARPRGTESRARVAGSYALDAQPSQRSSRRRTTPSHRRTPSAKVS